MGDRDDATASEPHGSSKTVLDVLRSREASYEMLAGFYFYPLSQEQLETLAQTDFSRYAQLNELSAQGVDTIEQVLAKRHSGTRELLAIDFASTFGGTHTYAGKSAVPYESVFRSESGLLMRESYQEVRRAYRAEAVRRREGFDWPDDHLAFLFQFLALLSRRAASALADGDGAEALRELEVSSGFLEEHVLTWFDEFSELARTMLKTRFYCGVLDLTKGWILFDQGLLQDLCEEIQGSGHELVA